MRARRRLHDNGVDVGVGQMRVEAVGAIHAQNVTKIHRGEGRTHTQN